MNKVEILLKNVLVFYLIIISQKIQVYISSIFYIKIKKLQEFWFQLYFFKLIDNRVIMVLI